MLPEEPPFSAGESVLELEHAYSESASGASSARAVRFIELMVV